MDYYPPKTQMHPTRSNILMQTHARSCRCLVTTLGNDTSAELSAVKREKTKLLHYNNEPTQTSFKGRTAYADVTRTSTVKEKARQSRYRRTCGVAALQQSTRPPRLLCSSSIKLAR